MNPAARDELLDREAVEEGRRELEVRTRESEYGARVASRKTILARWAAEEAIREAEYERLRRGDLTGSELAMSRKRRVEEDARRDGELASWAIENEAVEARIRVEDKQRALRLAAREALRKEAANGAH